ncbi:MAG: PKD domain-containing protein [Bacteroidetes bacterium]|nr:PKD domain-containing protein [Bacteroidota bacterium]MDA1336020.1 PKD domain-containing protein [Bacteroidota bacterium]
MKFDQSILIILMCLAFFGDVRAQEDIQISAGGTVVICDGFFFDDGLLGEVDGGPYTNQDYTITICPETDGDAIQVVFLAFDLQTNANPNNNDVLYVYDGDNTGAEMVGAGTNNSLQGVSFTASTFNPTGCLTFQFFSNNGATAGAAGWVGDISCVTPCTYPESGYEMTDPDPFEEGQPSVGVCPNQEVSFDGSSSLGDGVDLEYWIWNWGDGTVDSTSTPLTSHSYEEPGEYLVSLVVSDENSCTSVNLEVYQVLVSTIPIFNADFSSPLCTGSPGFLDGNPVQSITWTALPPLAVSEELPMPDATGAWFESELYIDFFDDGQVLEDCDDLLGINALMEHSFVGDLTIQVECPDGTQVVIMENNNSGADDCSGGTDLNGYYLGEPDDFDGTTPNPGVGYWYTFTENGEYLLDDADNPNVTGNTIPAGEYGLCGDICDFEGCPLNGIWTFQVIDQWGADNGFLFEWGIDFNPAIVPGVTTFTPTIGADMDSSYWQVSSSTYGVESIDPEADYVDLMFDEPGEYEFVYTVTNNFSCTWDTTVVVEVIPGLGNSVTAGADLIFCQDPVQLQGAFVGGEVSACSDVEGTISHCYGPNAYDVFTYCPDNPGDGTMMTIDFGSGMIEPFWDQLIIYDGDSDSAPVLANLDGDLTGLTYTATNADGCLTVVFTSDGWGSCQGGNYEEVTYCVSCGGQVECGYQWTWDPPTYLDDPTIPNPTVLDFDGMPIEYTLLVEPIGMPYCGTEDVVSVLPGFEYSVDFGEPSCLLTDGFVSVNINEPPSEGPWTLTLSEGGTLVETISSNGGLDVFDDLESGTYELELSDPAGCFYYMDILLTPPQPMDFDIEPIPQICINGYAVLEVSSTMDPSGSWTYTWDNGLGTGDSQVVNPVVDTDYTVFATDDNGCMSAAQTVTVQVYDSLQVDLNAPELICGGAFAELEAVSFNGGSGSGYNFNWTWENMPVGAGDSYWVDYPAGTGTYCVTLTDDCESPAYTICEEVVIETPIPADFSVDTTRACVPGVFQFESEVDPELISQTEWFFGDGELSYEASPVHDYLSPGGYDITFNITSLIGCHYTNFQPSMIQVYSRPYVGFYASPQPTRAPDTHIDFESVNSSNVVDWYWVFDNVQVLGESNLPDPDFDFPIDTGGEYPVTLVVTDENGCTSQITRLIEIQDMFSLYIPTAFTPNNDGVNDAFFIQGSDIDPERFELQIVNRWGNLVFETKDMNEVWYGPAVAESDHFAQDGVYFYYAVVYSLSNPAERKEVTGSVMITR